ncbi:MAG: DUF1127 domain-containing protein [Pseudomonadota bacterium]
MTVRTETYFAGTSIASQFGALRARWSEAAEKRRIFRTTVAELQNLNARELADLGIHPTSIHAIAREAAYGKE